MHERALLARVPSPHPDAAWRLLDGVAVVVTPADATLHTLDEVGTRLWELADGSRTGEQIVAQICAEYEVDPAEAARDYEAFAAEMIDKGLWRLDDGAAASTGEHRPEG